jgi:C4-dicarboxylate-specific signal transduction histidine kinase
MGTMASTLAHELNQPLAAVALYLENQLRLQFLEPELILLLGGEILDEPCEKPLALFTGSTLAHELNQPLAAVALYLETIRDMLDERDDEPFRARVRRPARAGSPRR